MQSSRKSKNMAENIERNMTLKDKELIATEQQKILDHNFSSIAKKLIESHTANAKV